MPIEITPEPTPGERAAIEQALATTAMSSEAHNRGVWWAEGVLENVVEDEEPAQRTPERQDRGR